MRRIDNDFEIVIEFLADIPAEFGRYDSFWLGVQAGDAKVNLVLGIQDADFSLLGRSLSLEWFTLQEVLDGSGLLPEGIIKRTV